jgi:hypothetical protein
MEKVTTHLVAETVHLRESPLLVFKIKTDFVFELDRGLIEERGDVGFVRHVPPDRQPHLDKDENAPDVASDGSADDVCESPAAQAKDSDGVGDDADEECREAAAIFVRCPWSMSRNNIRDQQ